MHMPNAALHGSARLPGGQQPFAFESECAGRGLTFGKQRLWALERLRGQHAVSTPSAVAKKTAQSK